MHKVVWNSPKILRIWRLICSSFSSSKFSTIQLYFYNHIIAHVLTVQWSSTWFSSSNEPFNFWDIIKRFAPLNTIKSIEDMSNKLQTSSGKVSTREQRPSVIQSLAGPSLDTFGPSSETTVTVF